MWNKIIMRRRNDGQTHVATYSYHISGDEFKLIYRHFNHTPEPKFHQTTMYFNLLFEDRSLYEDLLANGFNVKVMPNRDIDEPERYYVKVTLNYETSKTPPAVKQFTHAGAIIDLDESDITVLDRANIERVEMDLNQYFNENTGKSSFYLNKMKVLIGEDWFSKNDWFDNSSEPVQMSFDADLDPADIPF